MMKCKFLILFMLAAVASYAAQINDVRFVCDKGCRLVFSFASDKDLPTFFQKYDAATKKFTVGFSETSFALGEGSFNVDGKSKFVKSMKVFKETFRGTNFLKIEMEVGEAVSSDKNEISLDKANFLVKFKGKGGKDWTLSKMYASRKKAAEAEAAKQTVLDKKAAAKAAKEEKLRLAAEKKAAEKAAKEEKLRLAAEKKAAEKAALEEKKRLAAEKKAAEKQALLDKKAAEKAAKEEEKRIAEEQKQLEKAIKEGGAISALLPNLKEMTVLIGSGMEQFRLVATSPIEIKNVTGPDKASIITVGMSGPQKSPVFKIGAGSMIKYVTWGANGLKIQLQTGVNPVMMVQEGALILQIQENKVKKDGFVFWSAQPTGIYIRDWMKAVEEKPSFDVFVKKFEKDSKKIVSGSQTFHLRPVVRELIVVSDEIEFYAAPNENAQVLHRLVFGDRLVSIDLNGLYRKVQFGNRVGYVNKRSVSFRDELSSVQAERLKQVDKERGEELNAIEGPTSKLEDLYEDRVTYSSFGRRDPFVEIKGLVEEGINIDQVELVGIIWESEVPMAILVETKNPSVSYTVKEGDKILNGKVLKITQTDVLFLIQEFGVSRRYSMGLPDKFGGQK
ncbi:MAG: pilus assembly protein PilP [Fibrobacter sp.]|nr:pilus assembly protein PilP [Fibrobacter sp.]